MISTGLSADSFCQALPECGAVLVGGGSGNRFGGDKLSILIAGRPLLAWSLLALEETSAIRHIVLVVPISCEEAFRRIAHEAGISKLVAVVVGGRYRHESVARGLAMLPASVELVAIHDAARPLLTPDLLMRCLSVAAKNGAAAAATSVTDTLHQADQEKCAAHTVDRTGLWAMQTPQVFRAMPLRKLLEETRMNQPTDEVSVVLAAGWRVPFVENREPNLKVTWPDDFSVAEAILQARGKKS
jgi:2-C-methyl-D-erythritol 4-phosphate cytidylyltransferase